MSNKENQSVEDGHTLRAALLSGGAALERISHVENQSELGVEEPERLVPNPKGAYNIAWNEAIIEAIDVLKRHLSPTHGVITEVKKLIIP